MKMHQCPLCPKSFPSPYKLQRHYVIHTGQKPFSCRICGKAFTQSVHLKSHLQKVHSSRIPTDRPRGAVSTRNGSPNCDEPAARSNTHKSSSHALIQSTVASSVVSQTDWKRDIVTNKSFLPSPETGNPPKNLPHVKDAALTHNNISVVLEPEPQEQVSAENADTSISNAHGGYTCKVCLKSFTSSHQLWIHAPVHNGPKRFESSRETFSKKEYLQSQKLSSSGSQITLKHQCPKCLKTFCSPSKLQRHYLIHTGQKPYSCMVCWKAFRQKVHLKTHLRTAKDCSLSLGTERKKQGFCSARQTSGLQPQTSLQHRPTSHHAPVRSSVELELQCKISVNAVQDKNKTEIESDVAVKPERPLNTSSECQSICHKSEEQELMRERLTHKDLKPFSCKLCSRSFRLEVNLIRHCKIHRNHEGLGSLTTVQNSNNVKTADSEAVKHLQGPNRADLLDLKVVVKPETWSENCSDHNDSLPQDCELITTTEQRRETCHATSQQQRINNLHQCLACLKCFPSVSKLQRHVMTHTGQRPFGCEICGKRFRQKTHLRVHCRTHLWSRYHKQRSLYINRPPSCAGGFNTRTAADVPVQDTLILKANFEKHSGSDEVSVEHLDQTPSMVITQNANRESEKKSWPRILQKIEVVHLRKVSKVTAKRTQTPKSVQNPGSVGHKCLQCFKCFPSASKLQRHEMVHTGLKPFRCGLCGKAFRQAPHLKTHERTHCERKPSRPLSRQGNARKQKGNRQQQLYPRISVRVPPQKKCDSLPSFDINKSASSVLCAGREASVTKAKNLHTCRICFKSFIFPYKLSRHLVTHTGLRPYRCTWCSKTFTQRGHLRVHEQKCRQSSKILQFILPDGRTENQTTDTDFNVDATGQQLPPDSANVGHYPFTDGDLSDCLEEINTEWFAAPEVQEQRENCSQVTDNYDQAIDHYSCSFPTELAFEINKLVQNQVGEASLSSQRYEDNTHNVQLPCQHKGVGAISDNRLLRDELQTCVAENRMHPDNYWCEPLTVFDCDGCAASFSTENELKQHACSADPRPKISGKNHCDICLKCFVSPSKLSRHYLVHTGQRPFKCDVCGKTFTQASHARTHRLTH